MSIETIIVSVLTPLAPTTPFAAADPNARPRITYQRAAGSEVQALGGYAGLRRTRMQIDVWSNSASQSRVLADQAKVALRAGLTVGAISDNPDDYETDTGLHRASFDVAAWI